MITKRWARILREVIIDAREDANTAGTHNGGYNVFCCWRPNMGYSEMAIKMDAYDDSYKTAMRVRTSNMTDFEKDNLKKLIRYWSTDSAGRDRIDILDRLEAVENAIAVKN